MHSLLKLYTQPGGKKSTQRTVCESVCVYVSRNGNEIKLYIRDNHITVSFRIKFKVQSSKFFHHLSPAC